MEDINKLIHQLKRNGDYLVTGSEKLILNTEILNTIITRVLPSLHSEHNINHHYLSEILKKIPKLKLLKSTNTELDSSVDLSPFHNLVHLEIYNLDIEYFISLNYEKIEVLIINGPIKSLVPLFQQRWANLNYLALRGCGIKILDESILFAPFLTYFEAPRNLLTKTDNIEELQLLECLNLSINRLTQVPVLSDDGARNLTVLILNCNFINDLTGLSKLTNLKVLELSNNMILHHESISAVGDMAFLKYLNLKHNPIAYVKNHREITCKYLHENAAVDLFELDNQLLSKSEKKFAGQSSRSLDLSCLHYKEASTSSKGKKIRSPVIQDTEWDENSFAQTPIQNSTIKKEILKSEHLTTKKQIESVRQRFGEDNWLHSQGGSYVQGILGIKQQSEIESFSQEINEEQTVENNDLECDNFTFEKTYSELSNESRFEIDAQPEINDQNLKEHSNKECLLLKKDGFLEHSVNTWQAQIVDSKTGECSNILLCLSERDLKERNSVDGHLLVSWNRGAIESCVKIGFDPIKIQLNFMTIRKNLNQRIYSMSDDDAKVFLNIINMELESRTLSEMNQLVFKCMKCGTIFCQESSRHFAKDKRKNCCPSCDSVFVIQTEEEPLPSSSSQFMQNSEIVDQNFIDEANSNNSTPINSRSSSEEPEQRTLSRNDSDVEILSNPSDSSVEIIEVMSSTETKLKNPQLIVDVRTVLTESSSSGSMTDSVCTAYESQKQRNDSSSTLKGESRYNFDSMMSSIIDLPVYFSYNEFSSVDSRLKSYVQHTFFREKEEFVVVFRCNCIMTSPDYRIDGCVIISNKSFYVFKFIGQPDELLQKVSSHRLSLVKSIASLPWNVGLAICVSQPEFDMNYTFILYVPHITIRLIAYLERIKPFEQRALLLTSPNTNTYLCVNQMLFTNNLHLPISYVVFCECVTVTTDDGLVEIIDLAGLLITEFELVILGGECAWLLPYNEHLPTLAYVQGMSTFDHLDKNEKSLSIYFNNNVSWILTMNHVEAAFLITETIQMLMNARQKFSISVKLANEFAQLK